MSAVEQNSGLCFFRKASESQIIEGLFENCLIQSSLRFGDSEGVEVYGLLTHSFLALQMISKEQVYLMTEFDFDLKLNILKSNHQCFELQRERETQTGSSQMTRIRLFCQNKEIYQQWVRILSEKINVIGFHERFKPIRKLGRGSFAIVYEVRRIADGERFAVKAFSKELLKKDENQLKMLKNEIAILRSINHENLLKIEEVNESENTIYVITELLKGGSLLSYLRDKNFQIGSHEIKAVMNKLLKGLKHLHWHRIIHRDLKLQNIMMRSRKGTDPVIVDFGLGVFADSSEYLYTKCGTPGFIPPQFLMSYQEIVRFEPESDIFSIGVVFHTILTGRALFDGQTVKKVYENNKTFQFGLDSELIDSEQRDLLSKMLTLDWRERIKASECLDHSYLSTSKDYYPTSPTTTTCEDLILQTRFDFLKSDSK